MNAQKFEVKSRGFKIWKQWEAEHNSISMQGIANETGLGLSTVQKIVAKPDTVIDQATILGVAILSVFFGVKVDDMIVISEKRKSTEGATNANVAIVKEGREE